MSRVLCEQTCMGSFSETTHCQLLCFASHFMIAESFGKDLRLTLPHIQPVKNLPSFDTQLEVVVEKLKQWKKYPRSKDSAAF
ncbi:hypothetical protein KP509_08G021900 [Ceratopteris richardii]|uniref:Uncharacterized protein n=1 Tax=Ceratopteris richardii TaxID=49495 RepID=A0A8T2UAZ5_CERRI|nr:hypothetical protein KP509_08G021900 [Ceratopteris richardii]